MYVAAGEQAKWYNGCTVSNGRNEYYGFTIINNKNSEVANIFLHNTDLIQRFCMYFDEIALKIINDMSNYEGSKKENNLITGYGLTKNDYQEERIKFIQETPIQRLNFILSEDNDVTLSAKEISIITALMQGMSSQAIGTLRSRSKRTIEDQIDGIKNKFNVRTKSELIKKAFEFDLDRLINLLP